MKKWIERAAIFEAEAHKLLGKIETAKSRKITLDESYDRLTALSVSQDDLFRQALRCVEVGVMRAAHVMAWAACMDFLHELAGKDHFQAINLAMPKWNLSAGGDLGERFTDYAIIEALKKADLIKKAEMKAFHGMLSKRNECAHPSDFYPGMNETLGYVSELFRRIELLQKRHSM